MNFTSRSQAGQDIFFAHILGYKRGGSFCDIGCAEPVDISNSYALEHDLGWSGLLFDLSQKAIGECLARRTSRAVQGNAVIFDFRPELQLLPKTLDALSFDVDEAQVPALANFLAAADDTQTRFRVLCVETDRYRFGDKPREAIINMLSHRGYTLLADDVKSQGCPFETWWCDPKLVDMAKAEKFRSHGLDWQEVLKRGAWL